MPVSRRFMFFVVVFYFLLQNPCGHCHNLKQPTKSKNNDQWRRGAATFYGAPEGSGSTGGACGYGDTVEKSPLSKMISAGSPALYRGGEGCGSCYQIKCKENPLCSGNPVTVMITDECAGCNLKSAHFDLSGTAFGSLAIKGQGKKLQNAGVINLLYRRVKCSFGNSIAFSIDKGATPFYFATAVEYQNGDGDLVAIDLKQANSKEWLPMKRSWGATWALSLGFELQAPFTLKLREKSKLKGQFKTIVAEKVIPHQWKPGHVYRSSINF